MLFRKLAADYPRNYEGGFPAVHGI